MKALLDSLANIGELLCWERCRACYKTCRYHTQTYTRIKAVCQSCWSQISIQSPSPQWRETTDGNSFQIVSAVHYQGATKKLIYKMKYDSDLLLVGDLSELLMAAWIRLEQDLGSVTDDSVILVPIPLHPKRLKSRGFNQSELLAQELAKTTKLSLDPLALKRVKYTEAQHDLSRAERLLNLTGAFQGDSSRLTGKTVVLIDDVHTSGATLAEAAQEVLHQGASRVAGLTVACAILS